jgi:hypothetical protein
MKGKELNEKWHEHASAYPPGMDELRMEELSHRQMEIFWGKILGGSIIGGGVVVGGPAVVGPLLKLLQRTPVLAIP